MVIDQLTWLPANPADIIKSMPNDTRLHRHGGANLLAAAEAVGVKHYIVQLRGFYLDVPPGKLPTSRSNFATTLPAQSVKVRRSSERMKILSWARRGGPTLWLFLWSRHLVQALRSYCGTSTEGEALIIGEGNTVWSFVHIDDAIAETVTSLKAEPGVYNVVDDPSASRSGEIIL